jgi:hypothetical protein
VVPNKGCQEMPYRKWNKLWVTLKQPTGSGRNMVRGEGMEMMLVEEHPALERGDCLWALSNPSLTVQKANVKDRTRFRTREDPRVTYVHHPGLTESQKNHAVQQSMNLADRSASPQPQTPRSATPAPAPKKMSGKNRARAASTILSWFGWAGTFFGTYKFAGGAGATIYVSYRVWNLLGLTDWCRWSYDKVKGAVEFSEEVQEIYVEIQVRIAEDGDLWYLPYIFYFLAVLLVGRFFVIPVIGIFLDLLGMSDSGDGTGSWFRAFWGRNPTPTPHVSPRLDFVDPGTVVSDTDEEMNDDSGKMGILIQEQARISGEVTRLVGAIDRLITSGPTSPGDTPATPAPLTGPPAPVVTNDDEALMKARVDRMLDAARAYDEVVAKDSGKERPSIGARLGLGDDDEEEVEKSKRQRRRDKRRKKKKNKRDALDSSDSEPTSDEGSDQDAEQMTRLKELARNPREVLMKKLEANPNPKYAFRLPKNTKAHVARTLLAMFFASPGGTVYKGFLEWAEKRGAKDHPEVLAALPFAKTADRMILETPDRGLLESESIELIMRKVYGVMKRLDRVRVRGDWEKPSGSGNGWVSKEDLSIQKEIDFLGPEEDGFTLEAVDTELGKRLKAKALIAKHLNAGK